MTEYKKYKGLESNLQESVATYLDFLGLVWFHCPNEIKAKPQYMAKRKRQGVKSGVPDVCIMEPNTNYFGLFIELKVSGGKLSKNQTKWLNKLEGREYKVAVCWSFDETKSVVDNYLKLK